MLEAPVKWGVFSKSSRSKSVELVEAGVRAETVADDRYQHANRHRDPDLGLHRVLAGPEERLDSQVLLDPLLDLTDTCSCFRFKRFGP